MTPELSHPIASVLRRPRLPGQQEFSTLLGLLPFPALVLDRARETILMANAALVRLCGYPLSELSGALLLDLLPELPLAGLSQGDECSLQLRRRKRDPLPVTVKVHQLDENAGWILLQMEPADASRLTLPQMREMLIANRVEMSRLIEEPDLDHALARGIRAIRTLLDTNLICIYQAASSPQVTRVASTPEGQMFPETISPTDLIRLAEPAVWVPGKRVQAEVHRFGRISNLSYVATTPLGPEKGIFGLLVVGHPSRAPDEWLIGLVEMAGISLSLAMQYFLLSGNLRQEIDTCRERAATHATLFESAEEGIVLLSPDLKIMEMNSAAEWMLGYANWEVQRQPVENILIGPERLMPALQAACDGIPTHNIGSVSLHRRSGQPFPAHIQTIPIRQDGKQLGVLVFLTDVSVHEQAQLRTQQLEHRAILGDVTAVFAHEVRNPINNISTGLQLLASRLAPDDPNQEKISRMEGDCTRLTHLMESVLAFSRPMEPRFEAVDVVSLLQRFLERWRPRMARVNVEPFYNPAENLPRIWADPRQLEQVFTNLITNAIDAMSKTGGTLAVRVQKSDTMSAPPHLEIIVSDSGPGISEELREHIFEPFFTQKSSGTGLGLAITKRIITAHHGNISVDSFPGGTVFTILLPVVQGEDTSWRLPS